MSNQVSAGARPAPQNEGWFKHTRAVRVVISTGTFIIRKPLGAFGAFVLVLLVVVAVFASAIAPYGSLTQNTGPALTGPSWQHLAGTDQFGRDLFTRLVYGARISLAVAIGSSVIAMIPATLLGIVCAYYRGILDLIVQRAVDAVLAIPGLILLIGLVSVLGLGLRNVILALALPAIFTNARVMRSAALQIIGRDYLLAARAVGANPLRIMLVHILPNVAAPLIILVSLGFGRYILAEASLSFLGFGVPPPAPSWGGMLASDGRRYMYVAPHMFIFPALALSAVVFGVNMFGDALRDILDPKLRGSGH